MNITPINKSDLLATLPPEWPHSLLPEIQSAIVADGRKLVVLDDDPTGTQTVHHIPVLTEWPVAALEAELKNDRPAFYLLTNTRSLSLSEAQSLTWQIGKNLQEASRRAKKSFIVVSRSDSTLRGHYPGEIDALAKSLGSPFDACLIIPFFEEGGRHTVNDIHYVSEGEIFTPAGLTEFAQDSAFGYQASNLREWVSEKTGGEIATENVTSISINDIRQGGPDTVASRLNALRDGTVCVVNAMSYRDLEVFTRALVAAEANGKRFLYRTAASFIRVRAGLEPRPLLTANELDLPENGGGLIVVGSYVPKSTAQLQVLLKQPDLNSIEVNVEKLLDNEQAYQQEIERVARHANSSLKNNQDIAIYTGRHLVTGKNAQASLGIGQRVSTGLVEVVRSISTRPRYVLAKGGITSSDVATRGLDVKRAMVPGQILPGVPVWQLDDDSRYPDLTYIVFPGNVGNPGSLVEVVNRLR